MRKHPWAWLLVVFGVIACNFPFFSQAATPAPTVAVTQADAVIIPSEAAASPGSPTTAALPTLAPLLGGPVASPAGDPVNCRSGPGLMYQVLMILQPGQTAQIVAKTSDGAWFEVKNPSSSGGFCWLSSTYVKTTGDLGGLQIVAAPPTPVASPTSAFAYISKVSISLAPETISVAGCMGPIQPSKATAAITVTGPMKIVWHFVTDQNGSLPKQTENFPKAGTKYVTATFTPPLTPGTYSVRLVIDGISLDGLNAVGKYKIQC